MPNSVENEAENQENAEESEQEHSTESELDTEDDQVTTPTFQTSNPTLNLDDYDDSTEPKRVRSLRGIYEETEEVQLDEELFLMGVDEPATYSQAAKDIN